MEQKWTNSNRNLVIICQAPADVQYVIDLYSENSYRCNCIIVINVLNVFLFLKSLKLETEIHFIPYKLYSLKNIINVVREKKRLNDLWNRFSLYFINSDVYFFSRFEDWLTGFFLNRIIANSNNSVFYYNHYDNPDLYSRSNPSLSMKVRLFLLKYMTGVLFKGEIAIKFPEYPFHEKYHLVAPTEHVINEKYLYKIFDKKNALIFLSGSNEGLYAYDSYVGVICDVVNRLNLKGYNVYLKAHPRIGLQKEFAGLPATIIPEYIPSEFIDTSNITLCLGIDSTALVGFAINNIKTFSLLPLLQIVSDKQYVIMEKYLLKMSEGKIVFVNQSIFFN